MNSTPNTVIRSGNLKRNKMKRKAKKKKKKKEQKRKFVLLMIRVLIRQKPLVLIGNTGLELLRDSSRTSLAVIEPHTIMMRLEQERKRRRRRILLCVRFHLQPKMRTKGETECCGGVKRIEIGNASLADRRLRNTIDHCTSVKGAFGFFL